MEEAALTAPPSYVVVGTSAGGFAALSRIFKELPADFPGALLVVVHVPEGSGGSVLPAQLTRIGHLPAKLAEDGDAIAQGTAYVAHPGAHLLVEGGVLRLGSGPPEQHARPAIDVLFRSAAAAFGERVIGLILTGMLRDGTAGLRAVRDAGGITVVQDPASAEQGEMPRSAMKDLPVDYCVELDEVAPLLDLLVRRAGPAKRGVLETGLASSLRLMEGRVRLLGKLLGQSHGNRKTAVFLMAEIESLDAEIQRIHRMIAEVAASGA